MILLCLRRSWRGRASRYRASPSHCQTSLPCAYPCSSVAFLGITHPCLCISARLISLPGHASPSRFRAFPCNPYPSHCVEFLYVFVAAPHFDLHRFPFANPCVASRFHAPAVPRHAIPFNSIPMHRPSTRRLSLAAPGHTIHCADASQRSTLPYLCVATRFSTNPLHSSAVGSYSPPCLCFAMPLRFKAVQNHCVPWPLPASRCIAIASRPKANPLRAFAARLHASPSRFDSSQSKALPLHSLRCFSIPLPYIA